MPTIKQILDSFSDKIAEKINALNDKFKDINPFVGLSPNEGNSLSEDAEGKLYFKERTPEEIAQDYEGNEGVNRFTDEDKQTVDNFGQTIIDVESKTDNGGYTGTSQDLKDLVDLTEQKSNKVNNFNSPTSATNYPSVNAVEVRINEKLVPYYNNTQTKPFTEAEKLKLQAIDAAHYGAPVQDLTVLTAIPQTQLTDKERRYVEDEGVDYFYDVQMTTPGENDVAPDDQQNSTGFWRRTQIGGESATSVKTKYESNPDTNAFTDSHKTKVEGLPATVESVGGAQTKADTAESNAIAHSDANRADLEVQISENQENISVHEQRLNELPTNVASTENVATAKQEAINDQKIITVTASRALSDSDHKAILLITASVTLTNPGNLRSNFTCDLDVTDTGQATIDDAPGDGSTLDFPLGKILEADKMATIYKRPDNGKIRGKGEFSE